MTDKIFYGLAFGACAAIVVFVVIMMNTNSPAMHNNAEKIVDTATNIIVEDMEKYSNDAVEAIIHRDKKHKSK